MAQAKEGKRTRDAEAVGQAGNTGKLKRAVYERQLAKLHVELVKLQRWVVHEGLKVCVVFEDATAPAREGQSRRLLSA
jgi:polyphosphate kinase 2 (PPK2 family)